NQPKLPEYPMLESRRPSKDRGYCWQPKAKEPKPPVGLGEFASQAETAWFSRKREIHQLAGFLDRCSFKPPTRETL
ncbi:MAG TPA: hypothetical protein PK777_07440, partial [Thermoguttaceae bacterium]|nr:hypothetical protein [Thermoguttaceae bacterium]